MESFLASSKLLDILATLIGFAGVMLLLSIIVTSLVQMVQALFKLRSGNLIRGVAATLHDLNLEQGSEATKLAKKLLVSPLSKQRAGSNKTPGHYDRVSWIKPELLKERLQEDKSKEITDEMAEKFRKRFDLFQSYMCKRFARYSRVFSIIFAALVAFSLQVNSLELFRNLSVDPELRARYLEQSESLIDVAEKSALRTLSYEEVSGLALSQLSVNHPELDTLLEEVSGVGISQDELEDELKAVLVRAAPDKAESVTSEYGDLLEEYYSAQRQRATAQLNELSAQLAYFNLEVWPHGFAYYSIFANWLGVLMTVILISLGAPVWFRWLRFLVGLRDALKPAAEEDDAKK